MAWSSSAAVSRSDWFSTTSITAACPASGRRYRSCSAASAYFCGSTTQISMSTRGTSRSTVTRWLVSVESWSGRSNRTRLASSVPFDGTRWRRGTSSQSSRSPGSSVPQATAIAFDVVGRRTPAEASSVPLSALNVDDLPEPVAPASATTV